MRTFTAYTLSVKLFFTEKNQSFAKQKLIPGIGRRGTRRTKNASKCKDLVKQVMGAYHKDTVATLKGLLWDNWSTKIIKYNSEKKKALKIFDLC